MVAVSDRRQPGAASLDEAAPIVNVLTVDVEDYFQVSAFDDIVGRSQWDAMPSRVVANTQKLLDLFDQHRVRATCFVLGWVAARHPRLVGEIAARGHEVASHGFWHRLVYAQTPAEFRDDIRHARAAIEDASSRKVVGYRAPSFSIGPKSLWALDVLIDEGYEYDSSIFPIRHDRYGMPGAPRYVHEICREAGSIVELPPATASIGGIAVPVAGGGYFRLLPYAWTRSGLARLNNRERLPGVFYIHPWELDPEQPRLTASGLTRWRHYGNLTATQRRLECLLTDFRFGSVGQLLGSNAPAATLEPAAGL